MKLGRRRGGNLRPLNERSVCLLSPLAPCISSYSLSLSYLCRFVPSLYLLQPVTLPLPTPSRRWLIALPLRILNARLAYPSSLYCFFLLAFALPLFPNRRASNKIETVMRQTVGKPCDSAQLACLSLRHVVAIDVPGHHTFFPKSLAA